MPISVSVILLRNMAQAFLPNGILEHGSQLRYRLQPVKVVLLLEHLRNNDLYEQVVFDEQTGIPA